MENEILGGEPTAAAAPPVVEEVVAQAEAVEKQEAADVELVKEDEAECVAEKAKSNLIVDFELLYNEERAAHSITQSALAAAQGVIKRAAEMGFPVGAGIHRGA